MNDQDATIFQHRKTLFCQIRGVHHEKFYELVREGFPNAPATQVRGYKRFLGHRGEAESLHHRFYIADSFGELHREGSWIFARKAGNYVGIRAVRGQVTQEPQPDWVPGRVFVCEQWDDVVLCEMAHADEHESYADFRRKVVAAPLHWDERQVSFTNLEGREIKFCWKQDGSPTVDGVVPRYGGRRFNDPCVKSAIGSGRIAITCDGAHAILRAVAP